MKYGLYAFFMCQSMFCAIPAPQVWHEKSKGRMLLFFPLVGLEIGVIWAATAWLCRWLQLPQLMQAAILCAYPYVITGFIHLDGFMDVIDATKSWRDLERRREILKDSHVGSFAVIGIVLLMVAQFACFASVSADADLRVLLLIPAVSRCCSALAVTALPPMATSQYAGNEKKRSHIWVLAMQLCLVLAVGVWLCGSSALALLGCLLGHAWGLQRGYRSLQGMNGDISGYALTIGELCAVALYALI